MSRNMDNESSEALCVFSYFGKEILELLLHKGIALLLQLLRFHKGAAVDTC